MRSIQRIGIAYGLLVVLAMGCRPDAPESEQDEPADPSEQVSFYPLPGEPVQADTTLESIALRLNAIERELARLSAAPAFQPPGAQAETDAAGETVEDADAEVPAREQIEETAEDVRNFGLRVFWSFVILILFFFLVRGSAWVLEKLSERSAARRLFYKRLIPVARLVLWLAAIYYIIAVIFAVNRAGLLAAAAALGIAIGFAAQDVLKNIFGGIIIILDQPFQVGDMISVGGTYGEVTNIGLRSTRLITPDDKFVSVPNAQVVEGQVANANAGALHCQVGINLYVPGWVDVMRAKSIAYDAAASSKYVYLEKPVVVLVQDEFRETFLTHLQVKAYVIDTRYEGVFASDVTETAKTEFARCNMLFPVFGTSEIEDAWQQWSSNKRQEPSGDAP